MSNHRTDLNSWNSSILKKNVGFSNPNQKNSKSKGPTPHQKVALPPSGCCPPPGANPNNCVNSNSGNPSENNIESNLEQLAYQKLKDQRPQEI